MNYALGYLLQKSLRICASAVPDKLNFVKRGINEFETKIQDKKEIPYLVRKIVEAGEDILFCKSYRTYSGRYLFYPDCRQEGGLMI